jgi:hypothetical protein
MRTTQFLAAPFLLAAFFLPASSGGYAQVQPKPVLPAITFMNHPYQLGSYNQKNHPMWEFAPKGETVENWTSLVTIIDRADARSLQELDRLAEGIMNQYKSAGGQIVYSKTLQNDTGVVFDYIVAAFSDPAKHRFELNFVKVALGPKNAYTMIYGVRLSEVKAFLDQHSGEVGQALANAVPPDLTTLPRRVF